MQTPTLYLLFIINSPLLCIIEKVTLYHVLSAITLVYNKNSNRTHHAINVIINNNSRK